MNKFEQKLGETLVREGVISDDVLRAAERRQLEKGGRIDTNLLEIGAVDPDRLAELLAKAANCDAAGLAELDKIDDALIRGFPARLALRYRIIPFLKERRTLHIIMNDPLDLSLIEEISFLLNVPLKPHVVPEAWLEHALHKYYGIETHDRFLRLFDEKWGRPSPVPVVSAAADGNAEQPVPGAGSRPPAPGPAPDGASPAPPVPPAAPASRDAAGGDAAPPQSADAAGRPIVPDEKPYVYPRDFALRDVETAGTRDEILAAALKFFWQHFEFSAVFAVTGGRVKGWGCAGGVPQAAVFLRSFSAALDEPSIFKIMFETKSHYLGPLAPTAVNDELRESLGRPAVPGILLVPIVVKGRLVAAVYSDNGPAAVESHVIPELVAFTAGVAEALSDLILKKKRPQKTEGAKTGPPPRAETPQPAPASAALEQQAPAPIGQPPAAAPEPQTPAPVAAPIAEAQAGPVPAAADAETGPSGTGPAHTDEIVTAPVPVPVAPPEPPAAPPAPPIAAPEARAVTRPWSAVEEVPAFDAAEFEDVDKALEPPSPAAAEGPPAAGGVQPAGVVPTAAPPAGNAVPAAETEEEAGRRAAVDKVEKVVVAQGIAAPEERTAGTVEAAAPPPAAPGVSEIDALLSKLEASGRGVLDDAFTSLQEIGEACIPVLKKRFPGKLRIDPLSQTQRDVAEVEEHSDLIRLIIAIGRPCVEMLCELTRDADTNKRFYGVFTFSKLRYPEAIPFLLDRIFDSSPKVRLIALDVLHRFRSFPKFAVVTSRLRSELAGGDANRQRIAAIALGQFKDVESVPQLIKLIGSKDDDVAEASVQALVDLAKQNFGDSERKWTGWWRENKDVPRVRWLIEGLKHKDEDIRFMAIEELRELTGNFFSYFHDAPKKDREKSIERWEAWFKNEYQSKT